MLSRQPDLVPTDDDDLVGPLSAALQAGSEPGRPAPAPAELLKQLVDRSLADLPLPGSGRTLARWRALSEVAAHELSLAKLYEGHTDALAILRELGDAAAPERRSDGSTWGVWAAEPPDARVTLLPLGSGPSQSASRPPDGRDRPQVELRGRKAWCSGADTLSHALLTAWEADGSGPVLVKLALRQPGIEVSRAAWAAVGMAASASLDVRFDGAVGERVGPAGAYLARPGFWQGAIGIAACWHGGAVALARVLHARVPARGGGEGHTIGRVALGKVDAALQRSVALLRAAAHWIDRHPDRDAGTLALRTRLGVEDSVHTVIDEVGRVLGATPFCRDAHFARMAADLPVYVRQSHGDRDFAALGQQVAALPGSPWAL